MKAGISSQESLAHKAKVHRTYVERLERGESGVTVDSLAATPLNTVRDSRLVRIPPAIGALWCPRFDIVRARVQPLRQLIRALWPLSGIFR